jgi:NitT/TauT family transport system permease protein
MREQPLGPPTLSVPALKTAALSVLTALAVTATLLAGYQALRLLAGPRLFPSLPLVAGRLVRLIGDGVILPHAAASVRRVLLGLGLSVLVAVPAAGLLARFPRLDRLASPLLYLAYPVPKIVFLPVLMLLLGLGDASKVAVIFLIVVFQATVSLRDSFRALDRRAFQAVRAFGGGRLDLLRHVIVPASLPSLLSALRLSGGTAIAVLFMAESFASEDGMGFFVMDAWSRVAYADLHCGVLVLAALGLGLSALIDLAERLLCPWLRDDSRRPRPKKGNCP